MKKISIILSLSITFFTTSCMNPYKDNFVSVDQYNWTQPFKMDQGNTTKNKDVEIIRVDNIDNKFYDLLENGYYFLGDSNFSEAYISDSDALKQAKRIKADIVLLSKKIVGTETRLEPVFRPDYTSYAYVNRDGQIINSSYNLHRTDLVYVNSNIYQYHAIFMKKGEFLNNGLFLRNLTIKERQSINSNYGIFVLAVIKGSSAFKANILPGDIIIKLNNKQISDHKEFILQVNTLKEPYTVEINRENNIKTYHLNP